MAEGLLLEFTGVGQAEYEAVHAKLGIDVEHGTGYPAGLLMHTVAITGAGTLAVAEVWRSRADQEEFRADRLGSALASADHECTDRPVGLPAVVPGTPGCLSPGRPDHPSTARDQRPWPSRGDARTLQGVGQPRDLLELALLTLVSMVGFGAAIAALLGLHRPARAVS